MVNANKLTVLKSFKENFEKYKNKKIVLYGTSIISQFIMSEYADYNILGFLDGQKNYGYAFGKRIYSYEELEEIQPNIIIIAADKKNIRLIYDRICYFCYTNHISLYAVDGRNLFTSFDYNGYTEKQLRYSELNEDDLRSRIDANNTICFDIYDVLLMRKTLTNEDMLTIVEDKLRRRGIEIPDYIKMRQLAQSEITQANYTIDDIYINLINLTGVSDKTAMLARSIELEVEESITCSRDKMKELLLYAVKRKKQVVLKVDTYLTKEFIEKVLQKHEINPYVNIFLSDHEFEIELENNEEMSTCLYIGADAEKAKMYRTHNTVETFIIKSAQDMFEISTYRNLQHSLQSVNERSMAGLLISKVFNNPFSLYHADSRPEIQNTYDFGYSFVAPLITKYVLWIIEEMKTDSYDDILFAARDGYIVHKLYKLGLESMKIDIPVGTYFQTSRTLCTIVSTMDEEDIRWVADIPHAYAPELMLQRRFNLNPEDIEPYHEETYKDIVSYALHHKDVIYRNSEIVRKRYLEYMDDLGLSSDKRYAFVDFVSSGTCQRLLNKIIPFEIKGLYFCRYNKNDEAKLMLPVESLFESIAEHNIYCSYSYEQYLMLETMMTSLLPSIASMKSGGEFIYGHEARSQEELQYVEDIHRAIEDYFKDFVGNLYIQNVEINKYVVDTILSYHQLKYTNEHCSIFDNLRLMEDFGQWDMTLSRGN
ncbi:hypothetical protein [Paenibacillus sp. TSA_86.1]|uniref:hypothetical protein n=1 Tax=Paenibacillus sp. TSA_86.1 TaxID=3415649 RepID=UPI0040458922